MTDSKLAKQLAIPRRSPFRAGNVSISALGIVPAKYKNGKLQPPKAKRKSQAKVKR